MPLVLILLISSSTQASSDGEALQKASEAAYKQLGLEAAVNNIIKENVPKNYQEYAGKAYGIADCIINKRIQLEYRW